ncbi:Pentatricopeptide repeat-containing protein [Apostasia shenzhenica]|uniref:Pentatricopeptide repeat-containing protein n=1 Tax=Apostasia shenzhenica TaxID=1088818 RepID=A0A2I0AL14_9ASPA|nr:Pentatricopeptide repeat-containing protein [Apostasia shenzhenica]
MAVPAAAVAAAAALASPMTLEPTVLRRPAPPRLHSCSLLHRNANPSYLASTTVSGPRDNRQPIRRGRTLSSEAILAVQALKRSRRDDMAVDRVVSTSVARLIKADLLAALGELLRQNQWRLALKVFDAARREEWYRNDCGLYADMVSALARSGIDSEIAPLMAELMKELEKIGGIVEGDLRGPARLVKALLAAGKGEAVKDVYMMMKRGSCQPNEFLFKFIIKGLRGLGKEDMASEVEKDFELWVHGSFGMEPLPF